MIIFYELNELIEELKKEKIKIVRVQGFAETKALNSVISFQTFVMAKSKVDILKYEEEIGFVSTSETRRLNKMKTNAATREIDLKKILEKEGFEVRKGVYE